jgi:hypothetical protein
MCLLLINYGIILFKRISREQYEIQLLSCDKNPALAAQVLGMKILDV